MRRRQKAEGGRQNKARTERRWRVRISFCLLPSAFCLLSCQQTPSATVTVAPGVVFRRDAAAGVQTLTVDLAAADVQVVTVAENIERRGNNFIGDCKTVKEWAEKYGAVAGMNATFFGSAYDELGRRKQIVGLLVKEGRVAAPFGFVKVTDASGGKYTRSALGVTAKGVPSIVWATGTMSAPPKRYSAAVNPSVNPNAGTQWNVAFAAGCGPRLFASGKRSIADREERLVSAGKYSRAFVAYDFDTGGPRRLVFGRADGMEYAEVADYLTAFFRREFNTAPEEALCMDGGPSAQLVYRVNGALEDAEPTGVLVPTAILLLPKEDAKR